MDDLAHRPRWVYTDATSAVDYHALIPQRPWVVGTVGVGGSDVAAGGAKAAFQIRRDSLWHLTLRFREREWGNVERLIAHLQGDGSVTFYPDRLRSESHTIYGVSPEMGEEVTPRPSDEPSVQEIDITVRPTTAAVVRRRYYSKALWRFSAGDDARQITHTRSGAVGAYRSFDGPLVQAAANVLRTNWRLVNGVLRPYTLLEVPRTNHFTRSGDHGHADWGDFGLASVTEDTTVGPSGGLELATLVENGNNEQHGTEQGATLTADVAYALSWFVVADTRSWVNLCLYDAADSSPLARTWYDLDTLALGTPSLAGGATIEDAYFEDWTHVRPNLYRVVLVAILGSGVTGVRGLLGMSTGDGVTSYAGDGASAIRAGCAQLEEGREASTYIPTVAVAASRGAEVFSDAFPYTPQQLAEMGGATIYLDFIEGLIPSWVAEGGASPVLLGVCAAGAAGTRLLMDRVAGGDTYRMLHNSEGSSVDLNPARGNRIQLAGQFYFDGSVQLIGRKSGGSDVTGTPSNPVTLASAFGAQTIRLGGDGTAGRGIQEYGDAIVFPGPPMGIDECEREARAA